MVLSIDQGTSSCRAILFNLQGETIAIAQKEFTQIYPQAGWVEHDAMEIWDTQLYVIQEVITQASISKENIQSIGITNQRETIVIWDKITGIPIHNAIVWQDKRTTNYCQELTTKMGTTIQNKTGLIVDSYFSATKIKWILDTVPHAKTKLDNNELAIGTIDTWLLWKLTNGKQYATDYTNASRTMLFNIHTLCWDKELLDLFEIPESVLPIVKKSADDFGFAAISLLQNIPIHAVIGDQQGALYGQKCWQAGEAKSTFGTGCFMLMNTGKNATLATDGLLTTLAANESGSPCYAIEGAILDAGSAISWLRDGLQLIQSYDELEPLCNSVENTNGVFFVPALSGLGSPYWDMHARGLYIGISRSTTKAHMVRAVLESIAYQVKLLLHTMATNNTIAIKTLQIDGGISQNTFLNQYLSNVLAITIAVPSHSEITALGAAALAAKYTGHSLLQQTSYTLYHPQKQENNSLDQNYTQWTKAVQRTLNWL